MGAPSVGTHQAERMFTEPDAPARAALAGASGSEQSPAFVLQRAGEELHGTLRRAAGCQVAFVSDAQGAELFVQPVVAAIPQAVFRVDAEKNMGGVAQRRYVQPGGVLPALLLAVVQ